VLRHIWYVRLEAADVNRWGTPVVDDDVWNREVAFLRAHAI
jgi:hypothetical protein